MQPPAQVEGRVVPRGFGAFLGDGVATRAMDGLTGGAFLAGLALLLGAEDWHIGLLAAVPFAAQLMQIPALYIVQHFPDRRRVCMVASGVARLLLLLMGLVPLLTAGTSTGLALLLALFVLLSAWAALGGASWNAWLREILPRDRMGAIFSRRLVLQAITGGLVAVAAGALLDALRAGGRAAEGFALLYALGTAAGLVGVYFLSRMPASPPRAPQPPLELRAALARPFRDANFRRLMGFNASWGFAVNVAVPFITVYLLVRLGLPFALLGLFAAVAMASSVVALPLWGRLSDRYGNKPVLAICAPVFSLTLLLWVVAVRDSALATIAVVSLIHLLNGFANAGLDLASNNILLKLAPEHDAAAYMASASITRATASALGPLVGGALAAWFAPRSVRFDITWSAPGGQLVLTPVSLAHYDFLFLAAAVLGLYAVHRLAAVREEGEAPKEEVLRALRSEVAVLGTMMGLRRFAHVGGALAAVARSGAAPPLDGRRPPSGGKGEG